MAEVYIFQLDNGGRYSLVSIMNPDDRVDYRDCINKTLYLSPTDFLSFTRNNSEKQSCLFRESFSFHSVMRTLQAIFFPFHYVFFPHGRDEMKISC